MVCGGECPSLEAGLAQTNAQLRETGVLTVATVLTRGRVIHHIKSDQRPSCGEHRLMLSIGWATPCCAGSQPSELASPVLINISAVSRAHLAGWGRVPVAFLSWCATTSPHQSRLCGYAPTTNSMAANL